MARRTDQAAERKDRIDSAAVEVFAERGFSAATTAEIAARADVAEGTIFRHYASKRALLIGVLAPLARTVIAPLESRSVRAVMERDHASLADFLGDLFDDRLRLVRGGPPILKVFLQEATLHPEVRTLLADLFTKTLSAPFIQAIERMKEKGWIDPAYPAPIAMRLILSVFGAYFVARMLIFPDLDWDDAGERRHMLRLLARGLAPQEETNG